MYNELMYATDVLRSLECVCVTETDLESIGKPSTADFFVFCFVHIIFFFFLPVDHAVCIVLAHITAYKLCF